VSILDYYFTTYADHFPDRLRPAHHRQGEKTARNGGSMLRVTSDERRLRTSPQSVELGFTSYMLCCKHRKIA